MTPTQNAFFGIVITLLINLCIYNDNKYQHQPQTFFKEFIINHICYLGMIKCLFLKLNETFHSIGGFLYVRTFKSSIRFQKRRYSKKQSLSIIQFSENLNFELRTSSKSKIFDVNRHFRFSGISSRENFQKAPATSSTTCESKKWSFLSPVLPTQLTNQTKYKKGLVN